MRISTGTLLETGILYAHANSGMGGSPDKRDWNKLNAGETKREGGGVFQGGVSKLSANSHSRCERGLR